MSKPSLATQQVESQSGLYKLMSQIKISNKNFKRAKEMAQWVKGFAVQV